MKLVGILNQFLLEFIGCFMIGEFIEVKNHDV
ncbi:unknown [Prevotella sp. CAG:1124]|nr:unknown [Prevotella sp. CAG:1124]